mgnify:CR=1 FL=1|tara:strand:- start:4628 stop:5572 length:945 start_codon:yes stop_codon:yes gene_type:complete
MKQNETKIMPKLNEEYYCIHCNFSCSKKSNYKAHLLTAKHKKALNETNETRMNFDSNDLVCTSCLQSFSSRTTLWRHKKKCQKNAALHTDTPVPPKYDHEPSSIINILKQNSEFKDLIIEQNKLIQQQNDSIMKLVAKETPTQNNYNNITNNNQNFNLNFFLNTTCKDAINMSEFIENIKVELNELEEIGKSGYVSGMTTMILSRIKNMDVTKRPLHCTDLKRETMYIKENDTWNKETPNNSKLRKMISIVAAHNSDALRLWREKFPECQNWNSPKYEFCIKMMRNIVGDVGKEQIKLDNKIIKNIAKHIIIQK